MFEKNIYCHPNPIRLKLSRRRRCRPTVAVPPPLSHPCWSSCCIPALLVGAVELAARDGHSTVQPCAHQSAAEHRLEAGDRLFEHPPLAVTAKRSGGRNTHTEGRGVSSSSSSTQQVRAEAAVRNQRDDT